MSNPLQIGLFLPIGVPCARIDQHRATRSLAAKLFDDPNPLGATQFEVQHAGVRQTMHEQRLGFLRADTMDDAVVLRIQPRAHRVGQFRMWCQYQERFHSISVPTRVCLP